MMLVIIKKPVFNIGSKRNLKFLLILKCRICINRYNILFISFLLQNDGFSIIEIINNKLLFKILMEFVWLWSFFLVKILSDHQSSVVNFGSKEKKKRVLVAAKRFRKWSFNVREIIKSLTREVQEE